MEKELSHVLDVTHPSLSHRVTFDESYTSTMSDQKRLGSYTRDIDEKQPFLNTLGDGPLVFFALHFS